MSDNKEDCINSVNFNSVAPENLQLRQTRLSNPTQENIESYVNNLCNIYIEPGKKTSSMCRKTKTNMCRNIKTKIHHTERVQAMFSLITKSRRLDVPIDITLDLFYKLVYLFKFTRLKFGAILT